MEDLNNIRQRAHKVSLINRKTCTLTGVIDVLAFDVNEILLETDLGMLMIRGQELKVTRLTLEKGEVDIEGKVDSFTYSENTTFHNKAESIITRLFK
ncbi:MAG: sporulation protein YabP [Lachnospiraceae bacterium]